MVREHLTKKGQNVRFDRDDIVPGEDGRLRLDRLILAVEAVVFMVSPDSTSLTFAAAS